MKKPSLSAPITLPPSDNSTRKHLTGEDEGFQSHLSTKIKSEKNPFQSLSLKLQYFHIPTDEQGMDICISHSSILSHLDAAARVGGGYSKRLGFGDVRSLDICVFHSSILSLVDAAARVDTNTSTSTQRIVPFLPQNDRPSIRARNPKDEEAQFKCTNHSFPFKQQHKKTSNQRGPGFPISPQHKK
ncbi:hypothetical protein CEXT_69611 [Caerostris extrusa]|uniref:Uncharacterized protein n=1 Tax=Caerostris extrusa TaxID=172846 RepID=A0AAV4TDT8_CAEEX|nr:hypothetical protein CEXT_69611 [Caerostris extrusa]